MPSLCKPCRPTSLIRKQNRLNIMILAFGVGLWGIHPILTASPFLLFAPDIKAKCPAANRDLVAFSGDVFNHHALAGLTEEEALDVLAAVCQRC